MKIARAVGMALLLVSLVGCKAEPLAQEIQRNCREVAALYVSVLEPAEATPEREANMLRLCVKSRSVRYLQGL